MYFIWTVVAALDMLAAVEADTAVVVAALNMLAAVEADTATVVAVLDMLAAVEADTAVLVAVDIVEAVGASKAVVHLSKECSIRCNINSRRSTRHIVLAKLFLLALR